MPRPVPTVAVAPPRPVSSAPERVQPHPSLAAAFSGAPMYCMVVGDKISTKWKRQRRAVVLTSLFTLFCDLSGRVKRLVELSQIEEITLVAGQGKAEAPYILVRFLDKAEPDFLFQWRTDSRNTVPTPTAFVEVACKLTRARPPHREVPVTLDAQLPLALVARLFQHPERPKDRLGRYAKRVAEEARAAEFREAKEVELEESRNVELRQEAELAWAAGRGPEQEYEGDSFEEARPEVARTVHPGIAHPEMPHPEMPPVEMPMNYPEEPRVEVRGAQAVAAPRQARAVSEASAQTSSSVETGSSCTGEAGAVTVRAFFAGLNSAIVEQDPTHTIGGPLVGAAPAAPPPGDDEPEPISISMSKPAEPLSRPAALDECPPLPLRDNAAAPPAPPARPSFRTTPKSLRPPPPKRMNSSRKPPPTAFNFSPAKAAQDRSSPASPEGDDLVLPPPPPEPAMQLRRPSTAQVMNKGMDQGMGQSVGQGMNTMQGAAPAAPPPEERPAVVRLVPPPVGRRPSHKGTHADALGDIAQLLGGDAPVPGPRPATSAMDAPMPRAAPSTTPPMSRRLSDKRGLGTFVARPVVDNATGASPVLPTAGASPAVTAISARRTSPGAGSNPARRLNFGGTTTIPSFEQFGGTPEQRSPMPSGNLQEVMMRRL
eukprot:Hpha_TRINITY_DN15125_c1_g2::TRINITY_DN15125_c1_g2_i1::g.126453::m.126453